MTPSRAWDQTQERKGALWEWECRIWTIIAIAIRVTIIWLVLDRMRMTMDEAVPQQKRSGEDEGQEGQGSAFL